MNSDAWSEIEPLKKVTCSSYDCERDLHSFRSRRPRISGYRNERCFACEADLIDWQRLDRRDLSDVDYTIEALSKELIRHYYWHKPLDETAVNHARRKGLKGMRVATERRLRNSVLKASSDMPRDGRQTPLHGNAIYYAQHGTATCCRKCIEEWHAIDREKPLSDDEIGYMTDLAMRYVRDRMPDLEENGVYVPRRKRSA